MGLGFRREVGTVEQLTMRTLLLAATLSFFAGVAGAETPPQLRVGRAGHAFDHLGGYGAQAEAAAASGATILYATGLGGVGYSGLTPEKTFASQRDAVSEYNRTAKQRGIELMLGYLCATSIVKLETFDENWSDEFRGRFKTPPADWRQQDQTGQPLPSWYGGDYQPACMNNPDWRAYQEFMVRQQMETGHDGVFFDNPTVHPQGCYCPHCMARYAEFVQQKVPDANGAATAAWREHAKRHPKEFLRFRSTIGRDFLNHMRRYARTIKPDALVTCNNSLNSPDRLYAQARMHGYNIWELSQAEDFVVVEDMLTQPRTEANGRTFEYGPTYKQLHAISHGKPVVAVTIAGGDYHTAPNLVRLAMAEAAANGASYLSWPTWPENERQRMIDAIRPQADFLRQHESLLNDATFRADVVLFLPFQRWVDAEHCVASDLAAALSRANIQYRVVSEGAPLGIPTQRGALLVESLDVFTESERQAVEGYRETHGIVVTADQPEWLEQIRARLTKPSLQINGPATVRAVLRDQPGRTIVHLLNLNIERVSSFEDKVTAATDIGLKVRVPFRKVRVVNIHTADGQGTSEPLEFTSSLSGEESVVEVTVPRLETSAILVIDG